MYFLVDRSMFVCACVCLCVCVLWVLVCVLACAFVHVCVCGCVCVFVCCVRHADLWTVCVRWLRIVYFPGHPIRGPVRKATPRISVFVRGGYQIFERAVPCDRESTVQAGTRSAHRRYGPRNFQEDQFLEFMARMSVEEVQKGAFCVMSASERLNACACIRCACVCVCVCVCMCMCGVDGGGVSNRHIAAFIWTLAPLVCKREIKNTFHRQAWQNDACQIAAFYHGTCQPIDKCK